MSQNKHLMALDIGEKRVGVAMADGTVRIAVPYDTFEMDEPNFREMVANLVTANDIDTLVIGYPRNQSGEATQQTAYVEALASVLEDIDARVVYQDESLTSVMAEQRLKARGGDYSKGDIDAEAAVIILQDYMEHTL